MGKPKNGPASSVIIDRFTKIIPTELTPDQVVPHASHMSVLLREGRELAAEEKAARARFKARREKIDEDLEKVGGIVERGIEERGVEVEVHASYGDGKAREIRTDTGAVMSTRALSDAERQEHLFPPVSDDAYARGEIARTWWDEDFGRPEPVNPFKTKDDHTGWLRWRAGFHGIHDPAQPFTSAWEEGRMAKPDDTNPHVTGTAECIRWDAGHQDHVDPVTSYDRGQEDAVRVMVNAMTASGRANIASAIKRLEEFDIPNAEGGAPIDEEDYIAGYTLQAKPGVGGEDDDDAAEQTPEEGGELDDGELEE